MTTSEHPSRRHQVTLRFASEDWKSVKAMVEESGLTINSYFQKLALNTSMPTQRRQPIANHLLSEDKQLSLRLKPEEWAIIDEDARTSRLSRNAYLRQLALAAPLPRKRRVKMNDARVQVYSQMLGQLGKIGSNLNQIARHLNTVQKSGNTMTKPNHQYVLETIKEVEKLLSDTAKEALSELDSSQAP